MVKANDPVGQVTEFRFERLLLLFWRMTGNKVSARGPKNRMSQESKHAQARRENRASQGKGLSVGKDSVKREVLARDRGAASGRGLRDHIP